MPGAASRGSTKGRRRVRALGVVLVLALHATVAVAPGCSFEAAPVTGETRVAPSPVPGGGGVGGPPAGSDPTPVGGGEPKPVAGAGAIPAAGTGGMPFGADGGGSQPGLDASVGNPLPTEPAEPGTLFSRCVFELACDDDLTCYGDRMGYCTESCEEDDDCTDHGGVDFTCSDQQCRVDCGASGTAGECPAPLACTPQLLVGERCLLPRE